MFVYAGNCSPAHLSRDIYDVIKRVGGMRILSVS